MLPKAVLSFVGRLVGIAAVLVSPLAPLVAHAAETPDAKPAAAKPGPAHGHHHKAADRKAKKRGTRHLETPATVRNDDPAVTTERASAKTPPKQSSTPLPTLAAVTTKPLVEPIATNAHATRHELTIETKGHAAEPRTTPILRVMSHTDEAEVTPHHSADATPRHEKHAKAACLHAPISVSRGTEEQTFSLTKCDGTALPQAIEELSILVRPGNAAKPSSPIGEVSAKTAKAAKEDELAPGIRKIDERLVERLGLVINHFAKPAVTPKVFVVSGYRPTSKGSFHATGRAIDFRVEGVENTDLVAFCKTLPDTGCGFYPNSSFIHLDVRDAGSGHVSWIDTSGPGEKPEYVAVWPLPPPSDEDAVKQLARLDELQLLPPAPATNHDQKPADEKSSDQVDEAVLAEPASVTRKLEDE